MPVYSPSRGRAAYRAGLLFLLTLVCVPAARGRDDDEDKKAATELVGELRKSATGDTLLGVLLDGKASKKADEKLQLQGFVDRVSQRGLIEQEAAKLLEKNAAFRAAFPKGVSAMGLKELPLRTRIQKEFATGKLDDKTREVLRQTRVEGVSGDDKTLTCRCLCIFSEPGKADPDVKAVVAKVAQELIDAEPALKDAGLKVEAVVKMVAQPDRPTCVIQHRAAADAKLDGTLVQRAAFDDKGTLVLEGRLPTEEARKAFDGFMKEEDTKYHWCRPETLGDEPRWSVEGLKPTPWKALTELQEGLTAPKQSRSLQQTRLDRVYYDYFGLTKEERDAGKDIGLLVLRLEGLSFANFKTDKKAQDELQEWTFMVERKYGAVPRDRFKEAIDPGIDLQSLVAVNKSLDGVRVDAKSRFAPDGKLVLQGVWRDKEQRKELQDLCDNYFGVRSVTLRGAKASLDEFTVLPTAKILASLRERVARQLEDVLVQRLYFDKNYELVVDGFFANDSDKDQVETWLKDLTKEYLGGDKSTKVGPRRVELVSRVLLAEALADPPEKVRANLTKWRSLADFLRAQVQYPSDPAADVTGYKVMWDGILLKKCSFDKDGAYVVEALFDSEAQQKDFIAKVSELSKSDDWRAYFAKPWNRQFKLLPMKPMLSRLQTVMPSFQVFDGLTLDGAVHDTEGKLLLRVQVVGPRPKKEARERMVALLNTSRTWSDRVVVGVGSRKKGGVAFRYVSEQDRNPELAEQMLLKGLSCMRLLDISTAQQNVDTALLHNPGDSTGWFLRGMAHLLRNDKEQAERDLRRAALREEPDESDGAYQSTQRARKLEMIQGPYRRMVEVVLKKVTLDVRAGKPPVSRLE